jgi:hypothetical protein
MMTKEFKIVEIGVEEGFDLGSGIKISLISNVVSYEGIFYQLMLCKWTTSLAHSTWAKFNANIECVMSLKRLHVR